MGCGRERMGCERGRQWGFERKGEWDGRESGRRREEVSGMREWGVKVGCKGDREWVVRGELGGREREGRCKREKEWDVRGRERVG